MQRTAEDDLQRRLHQLGTAALYSLDASRVPLAVFLDFMASFLTAPLPGSPRAKSATFEDGCCSCSGKSS